MGLLGSEGEGFECYEDFSPVLTLSLTENGYGLSIRAKRRL